MAGEVTVFGLLVFYKIVTLLVGLSFAYMGYRLFLADKSRPAGDLEASAGKYALSLKGGAPGIFFSLFGTVLICVSILKGATFDKASLAAGSSTDLQIVIPDRPPFAVGESKGGK